jgi:hypothetical protein
MKMRAGIDFGRYPGEKKVGRRVLMTTEHADKKGFHGINS